MKAVALAKKAGEAPPAALEGLLDARGVADAKSINSHFPPEVGRCRLPVSKPVLKAPMVSALETEI